MRLQITEQGTSSIASDNGKKPDKLTAPLSTMVSNIGLSLYH